MGELLGGGNSAAKRAAAQARAQAEASQRTNLAQLASQQAETDQQASSSTPRARKGRRLLTFLGGEPETVG